jgi:hypothetical protein
MRQGGVNLGRKEREMPRNRPVGAFGIFGEGDVPDFENDYFTSNCNFCGKKYDVLGGVEIFLQVFLDARYMVQHKNGKFTKERTGTGGYICFSCFNAGPQRLADRYEKRAAQLKRPDYKENALIEAACFRGIQDFTVFKGYKLAKAIADAQ